MITAKDLIALGYKPAPWFKEAIRYANDHNLNEENLLSYIEMITPKLMIPFEEHIPYHKNIRAETEYERVNVQQVFESMDIVMHTPTIIKGAVMPDACPTGALGQIPVGGVIGAKNAMHPGMHSADICCSVMMTNFGKIDPKIILNTAHSITHFGGGGRKEFSHLPNHIVEKILLTRIIHQAHI